MVVLALALAVGGLVAIRFGRTRTLPVALIAVIGAIAWAAPADAATDCPQTTTSTTIAPTTTTAPVVAPTALPTETTATTTTTGPAPTTTFAPATTTTGVPTTTTAAPTTTTTIPPFDPAVAVSFGATVDPLFCSIVGTMTGFLADTEYTMRFAGSSPTATSPPFQVWNYQVTTDGTGAATYAPFSYSQLAPNHFAITVDGVRSPATRVAC